jgi:hypothetical protein
VIIEGKTNRRNGGRYSRSCQGMNLANNRVYVATTAKELACRGYIVVYAPE